jgi:hypothetical protein
VVVYGSLKGLGMDVLLVTWAEEISKIDKEMR